MSPFQYKGYREFLRARCKNPEVERGFQAALAKAAGCQASYLSQVLQDHVHLSEDQALGVAQKLELTKKETDFFLLLLRFEKASTPNLRKFLEDNMALALQDYEMQGQKVPADNVVYKDEDIGRYVNSWIPSAVHLLTSSSDYNTPLSMARRLNVPVQVVENVLTDLKRMDFVEKREGKWVFKGGSMHVPKNSLWQACMQTGRRQLALRSISINPDEAIHFSSIFTIDKQDIPALKTMVQSFLDKSHKQIKSSGSEELCCLCLDLFVVV